MDIRFEEMTAYRIAYIRQTGPYGISNVHAMEALKKWAHLHRLLNDGSVILGIAHDDPQTTEPENCRYDACIVVEKDYSINDVNIKEGNLAGGKYAVFKIEHTAEAVQRAWGEIFPELIRQGYRFDQARPIIERYISQMVSDHYCEICVPLF